MIETHYDEYLAERRWANIIGRILVFCLVFIVTIVVIHSQYKPVADLLDDSGCTVRTDKSPVQDILSGGVSTEQEARRLAQQYFDTPLTRTNANASSLCETYYIFKSEKLEGAVVCDDGRIIKTYLICPDDPFEIVKGANISQSVT